MPPESRTGLHDLQRPAEVRKFPAVSDGKPGSADRQSGRVILEKSDQMPVIVTGLRIDPLQFLLLCRKKNSPHAAAKKRSGYSRSLSSCAFFAEISGSPGSGNPSPSKRPDQKPALDQRRRFGRRRKLSRESALTLAARKAPHSKLPAGHPYPSRAAQLVTDDHPGAKARMAVRIPSVSRNR